MTSTNSQRQYFHTRSNGTLYQQCVDQWTKRYGTPDTQPAKTPGSTAMTSTNPKNDDALRFCAEFNSTGEAYNASQCREDIVDGDVLSVPSEGVVGVLVAAWPIPEWGSLEYGDYTVSAELARDVAAKLTPATQSTAAATPAVPVFENLTLGQKMGVHCVFCGKTFNADQPSVPVGRNEIGSQVFACTPPCVTSTTETGQEN